MRKTIGSKSSHVFASIFIPKNDNIFKNNMNIKEKISSKKDSISHKIEYLKSDVKDVRGILETKDVIYLKTDSIAVLVKRRGELKKFLEKVDMITKEGYELQAQEAITDAVPKLNMILAYLYIFQNKKFIK